MSPIQQSAVRNRLLAALPPDDFAVLAPSLRPVGLEIRQVLHEPEQPIEAVYFPESGMVSQLAPLDGGELLEVGIAGREGMVGLAVVLGGDGATTEAMVQAPGAALLVPAPALRAGLDQAPALRAALLRYVHAFHAQVAVTAACNARHGLEQRLARWLLMAHDRAERDEFPLTHEFASMMLGVRRAGVSVAAGVLQRARVIGYERGTVTVLDRPGLEAASCECYRLAQRHFDRTPAPASSASY